jgi:hypothetical protein
MSAKGTILYNWASSMDLSPFMSQIKNFKETTDIAGSRENSSAYAI